MSLFSLLAPLDTEPPPYPFVPSDVAQLQRLAPGLAPIDEQTWGDLLLEPYSEVLSDGVSIAGRQVLHRRLVSGVDDIDARTLHVRALMEDPPALAALHTRMRPLRRAEVESATVLYASTPPTPPGWIKWTALLPLALILSIVAVILSPLAWLAAGAVLFFLMSMQMRYHQQVEAWTRQLHALQMVLATTALLDRPEFAELAPQARVLHKHLSRSAATSLPGMAGYADWFALANVKHYFASTALAFAERAFLQRCYLACGDLEADVALARHLLGRDDWCWSERGEQLALAGATHPLMEYASPLSLALHGKGAFLSGRNGVGKSTFLRTVGINMVVARAFGFCYATSATLPALPVHASMRSEDSLLNGESLYLAELRRAKELLAASHRAVPGIFLVDEIFRGTNHLESVSAAAAVLDDLASRALVLVSSHNLVLAPLLAHRLDAYFIARADDGTLTVAPGVLAHTNGISLLADHGFGADIEENAARVCAWLGEREVAAGESTSLSWSGCV
ncbi:MAG: hypothetical protein M3Y65_12530 [Pseudomonadota bacterium]|nr:hypothetical protein [Pseudomonadota bacterium]